MSLKLCPNDGAELQLSMDDDGPFYYCPDCGDDWDVE